MQTILGVTGDIGKLLAKELSSYTTDIRVVSRNPVRINDTDEIFPADLLKADEVMKAVAGSEIVYLVAGLKYHLPTWQQQWPVVIRNVIDACVTAGAKLVFFDNVYMYDKKAIPHMTESSPINPPSEKGKVRTRVVAALNDAVRDRGLQLLIARCADFYGPGAKNGILNVLVTTNMLNNTTANWQSDANKMHSFTFTPDAAKATAILGNTPGAFGQVWHLPASSEKLTGHQLIDLSARLAGKPAKFRVLKPWMMALGGLFSSQIRELKEMQYQNNQDYFFDSGKFNEAFAFRPTTYEEGIRLTLAAGA